MHSFRSPKHQAQHATRAKTTHGIPRYQNRRSGAIHSLGTERNYTQALIGAGKWLQKNRSGDLQNLTIALTEQYLAYRAGKVRQKTLDLDRQALQVILGQQLDFVKSLLSPSLRAAQSRAYTPEQVEEICAHQADHATLATQISYAAGLRSAELLTLRPAHERPASAHRIWSSNRFSGRNDCRIFTVEGKGGLIREVAIPKNLAEKLEERRQPTARIVSDRGIFRESVFSIPGGKKWSADFSRASKEALGFSLGAHGLRHSYAQERVIELQGQGFSWDVAKGIVAQELGHFAMNTTEVYLR